MIRNKYHLCKAMKITLPVDAYALQGHLHAHHLPYGQTQSTIHFHTCTLHSNILADLLEFEL